ncbi:MAG: DNA repair protein RecN [Agathobacter sp.]|nr:DNA repair protein RecN [Agathobacter sp.]
MLQNLHVKNLALIDESEVELHYGMNVLTGETGAGKSIIIGSINLALGEKIPREMLRDNDKPALVELLFVVDRQETKEKLRELDVELTDDTVLLSRKISAGRAVGRVNGETVSVSRMKEIAGLLIDIHGQNEHQSLSNKKKHLEMIDAYGKKELTPLKDNVRKLYHTYSRLKEEWDGANLDTGQRQREASLLEYEVQEITEANLKVGEDEDLEEDFKRFSNGKKILEAVNHAYEITGGEMESASSAIGRAVRELSMVSSYDKTVESLESQLLEIDSLLSDFNRDLSGYLDENDFDEATFYEMEKRLDVINHLKSKYGETIEEILGALDEKSARLEQLQDYDAYLDKLKQQLSKGTEELRQASKELSDARKKVAEQFTKEVKQALGDLNFLHVEFEMPFEETPDFTPNGMDDAQFMISTNPGEPIKPLVKVASGGEMSRIMLAIKTVMAESDDIECLIFDEIDVGISGRTAQMVSEKMNVLSRNHQIIVITHLPQIAAMADSHYLIEKSVNQEITTSHIFPLEEEDAVKELARMLGGVEITDAVLENAKEMKALAYRMK